MRFRALRRLLAFVLLGAFLRSATVALAQPSAPIPAKPTGLVVVIDPSNFADGTWKTALDNPTMSGVALQIHWSDIEPSEGNPDWSKLDELFAAAKASKKWVQLLIFPGFFTPAWALQGVKTDSFPYQYGPGQGTVGTLPMPWDTTYLGRWFAFVKLVAARYGSSPEFRVIAADGPTSVSAEFTLPNSADDLVKWQADGYTPSRWVAAWKTVYQTYAADFPDQYISVSVGSGLNINDKGKIGPHPHENTKQDVVDAAMNALGSRMALQLSDVHAGPGPNLPNSESEDQYVIGYIGQMVTGFQMRSAAIGATRVMGAPGDAPLALSRSIGFALEPDAAGQHVDYVEIYARDVLSDQMQSVLRDAASKFASVPSSHG